MPRPEQHIVHWLLGHVHPLQYWSHTSPPVVLELVRMQVVREGVRGARLGAAHLAVYRASPTVEDLRALDGAHRIVRDEYPGRSVVFSLVHGGLSLPDAQVRAFVAELQREIGPQVLCSGTVLGGSGFWASAAISLLNTWTLVSRVPSPQRSFGDIDTAAQWVSEHMHPADRIDAATLAQALRQLDTDDDAPEA